MSTRRTLAAVVLVASGGYMAPASAVTTVLGDLALLDGGALIRVRICTMRLE